MTKNQEYRCNQCTEIIEGDEISYAETRLFGKLYYSVYHPLSKKTEGTYAPNCISLESLGLWKAHLSSCNATLVSCTKKDLEAKIIEQGKLRGER